MTPERRHVRPTVLLLATGMVIVVATGDVWAQQQDQSSRQQDESSQQQEQQGQQQGRLRHRVALSAGVDARLSPELGGHGYGLLAYDLEGLPADSRLSISYNTDTVRVQLDRLRFASGVLEAHFDAAFEFTFAGLLPDYFRRGLIDPERGFNAGYYFFGGGLKANLPRNNYLDLSIHARRWVFSRNERTSEELVLPPDLWAIETRLIWTYWKLRDDPSITERHRLFPRVRGVAFGVELGLDLRNESRPFGALDPEEFTPVDPRNSGETTILLFRQWLRAGVQVSSNVRVQVAQWMGAGQGEDDLTRARIGGTNPYVVPLVGAPWAALLADLFVAVELSVHFRFWREMEFGFLADGLTMRDSQRIGEKEMDFFGGLGGFIDLRFGAFQLDVRGGWTPSFATSDTGHFNIFAAFGWQWRSY